MQNNHMQENVLVNAKLPCAGKCGKPCACRNAQLKIELILLVLILNSSMQIKVKGLRHWNNLVTGCLPEHTLRVYNFLSWFRADVGIVGELRVLIRLHIWKGLQSAAFSTQLHRSAGSQPISIMVLPSSPRSWSIMLCPYAFSNYKSMAVFEFVRFVLHQLSFSHG